MESFNREPFTQEDFADGTVNKYFAAKKAKEVAEANAEEVAYKSSLQNLDNLKEIRESGSPDEKAKAFDYMVSSKLETETAPKTETSERPSHSKVRVPFPNKLIDKG